MGYIFIIINQINYTGDLFFCFRNTSTNRFQGRKRLKRDYAIPWIQYYDNRKWVTFQSSTLVNLTRRSHWWLVQNCGLLPQTVPSAGKCEAQSKFKTILSYAKKNLQIPFSLSSGQLTHTAPGATYIYWQIHPNSFAHINQCWIWPQTSKLVFSSQFSGTY